MGKKRRAKRGYGKRIAAVACFALLSVLAWKLSFNGKPEEAAKSEDAPDALDLILKKASAVPVASRFSSVIIFSDEGAGLFRFAGSGSAFSGKEGEQIITAEHLFPRSSGLKPYAVKLLRSKSPGVRAIEKVQYTGKEMTGDMADVVILKLGSSKPIAGFSIHTLGLQTIAKTEVYPFLEELSLTSLVSGEKVRIMGRMSDPLGTKLKYLLIDYDPVEGESGTGFIDDKDNLFVLKGNVPNLGPELFPSLGKFRAVSLVYGPLLFR